MVSSVMSQHISCATVVMAKTGIYSGTPSNGLSKDPQFNQGCKKPRFFKESFFLGFLGFIGFLYKDRQRDGSYQTLRSAAECNVVTFG